MRVPLTGGAYSARSVIASAQRCVNLYAEKNPQDSPVPYTYYGAPGLVSLSPARNEPGRCDYVANNDVLYHVTGPNVFRVNPDWTFQHLGVIGSSSGHVSMSDNGTTALLVDGSNRGWTIDLTTHVMAEVTSATNAPDPASGTYDFHGANRVDAIDGFLVLNWPGTRNFYSTYLNQIVFDALYFAAKNGRSDNLVTVATTHREIVLIGERTSEPWFNAGNAKFPYEIIPGAFLEIGCEAVHSLARAGAGVLFWLARDENGAKMVVRYENHQVTRVSNHAMEAAMAAYPTTADAEGFCFQMGGHYFYQINFPAADRSWRFDETVPDQFSEVLWTDADGGEHRHRAATCAFAYGRNVCTDWETGELYAFDFDADTDAGRPIVWRRGWPHMMGDGRLVNYPGFVLDIEAGTAPNAASIPGPFPMRTGADDIRDAGPDPDADAVLAGPAPPDPLVAIPQVWLRWSNDRGRTWGSSLPQSLGGTGQYKTQPQWNRTGIARDRVFEAFGVRSGRLAINGAFLDPSPIILGS